MGAWFATRGVGRVTIYSRLMEVLKPFVGAKNHPENRAKIRSLVLEELPQLDPESLDLMMNDILIEKDPG